MISEVLKMKMCILLVEKVFAEVEDNKKDKEKLEDV